MYSRILLTLLALVVIWPLVWVLRYTPYIGAFIGLPVLVMLIGYNILAAVFGLPYVF